jgi:hypothetical protein
VVSAILFCESKGENLKVERDVEMRSHLTDYLLELVACGVRQIFLVCTGNCQHTQANASNSFCQEVHSVACQTKVKPEEEKPWSYHEEKLSILSHSLSFRQLSLLDHNEDRAEFLSLLGEILEFNYEHRVPTCGIPLLIGYYRHTPGSAPGMPRHQLVYDHLRGGQESLFTVMTSNLHLSSLITHVDFSSPDSSLASVLSSILELKAK